MINQDEIVPYLDENLPEISAELEHKKPNIYQSVQTLSAFMCRETAAHNFGIVKRCMKIADTLYNSGNAVVKTAIENVLVFSLTKFFMYHPAEKQELIGIVPSRLYSLYISQVYHKGC